MKILRIVIGIICAMSAVTELPAQARQKTDSSSIDITVKRLSPRIGLFYGGPWDNAVVALATEKGLVVVDAPFSKTISREFRTAIQTEFKRNDFAFLINTHEHVCHVGGNEAYADLSIIGHETLRKEMIKSKADPKRASGVREVGEREIARARDYLRKNNPKLLEDPGFVKYEKSWGIIQADYREDPAVVPPSVTFGHDMTLSLGDVTVKMEYYGYAHGIADIVVSIPEENLVLTAGILYPDKVPVTDKVAEDATPAIVDNWFVVMRGLLKRADDSTKFIASHGRAVMDRHTVGNLVAYLEGLWNGLRNARVSGKTLEQAETAMPLKDFPQVASLSNVLLPGTEWEVLDIHRQNVRHFWNVLSK